MARRASRRTSLPAAAAQPLRLAAMTLVSLALAAAPARAEEGAKGPGTGSDAQRQAGQKLYEKYCSQCHGEKGDGQGPAAKHLRPMPRDFTAGKYKIRTTPNGALPMHEDIVHIIRQGMPYTSMPAWPDFSNDEVSNLAFYVASFSPDFANPERNPKPVELKAGKASSKLYATNWELSTARAAWIVRYLIQKHHFDPRLLSAAGFAEYHPIASNDTEPGRERNRRVEILVLSK